MEEMGDWAKVLEVIDSENAETAAAEGEGAAEVSHERLFLREDGWDGPNFLRCSQKKVAPPPKYSLNWVPPSSPPPPPLPPFLSFS